MQLQSTRGEYAGTKVRYEIILFQEWCGLATGGWRKGMEGESGLSQPSGQQHALHTNNFKNTCSLIGANEVLLAVVSP